jgi:hypothetical protein
LIVAAARFRYAAALALACAMALALPSSAGAASDVRVNEPLDCVLHPRKIAIQNHGDTAQSLAGWKLLSNKPGEEFNLGVPGKSPSSIAPGEVFYVFNGHMSQPEPYQSGDSWIYPWNYTPILDESFFVLFPDGTDFIRLVDASGFPWREVSNMSCPDNPGPIPPLQQPTTPTPTPPPSNPGPGDGGNTGGTDGNQTTGGQTDTTQSTGASQNAATSGNAATGAGGNTAQAGNVSGQAAGGPASGIGLLSGSSGSPFAAHPLLGLLGVAGSAALSLLGLRLLHRALRRPERTNDAF